MCWWAIRGWENRLCSSGSAITTSSRITWRQSEWTSGSECWTLTTKCVSFRFGTQLANNVSEQSPAPTTEVHDFQYQTHRQSWSFTTSRTQALSNKYSNSGCRKSRPIQIARCWLQLWVTNLICARKYQMYKWMNSFKLSTFQLTFCLQNLAMELKKCLLSSVKLSFRTLKCANLKRIKNLKIDNFLKKKKSAVENRLESYPFFLINSSFLTFNPILFWFALRHFYFILF